MAKKKVKKKVKAKKVTVEDVHMAVAEARWAMESLAARISTQMCDLAIAALDGRITPIAGKKKGTVKR